MRIATAMPKLFRVTFGLLLVAVSYAAVAQDNPRTRDNLMVVVRESVGANRPDDALAPTGKAKAMLPDGRVVEIEMASWEFIGDTHIRFVFDGKTSMAGAQAEDFAKLGVPNVEDALALAMANVKRVYGEPTAKPSQFGVFQLMGKSPDLDSSYFLDRAFWQQLTKANPEGIVAALPTRGQLLYTPTNNAVGVDALRRNVAVWHETAGRMAVSSALFLFKDGRWSVFQPPSKR